MTVGIGKMVSDVVFAMTPTATGKASGTVMDSHGQPMSGMILVMHTVNGATTMASGFPLRPDGSFVINGVTPGEYTLQAQPRPGGDEVAIAKITVAGGDINDLRLVASKATSIAGRILVDPGQTLPAGSTLTVMAVATQQSEMMTGFGMAAPGRVGDDNAFTLKSGPGMKRLRIQGLPGGWDIRAVRLRGADVTDSGIDVTPGQDVDGVDVELTNRLTTVAGLVTDARGDAAKDYTALIFPQDQSLWANQSRYIRISRPDQDGRFTIAGLPPGDYCAIALDHLDQGKIGDADFMNGLRSSAKSFSLTEGETKPIDLKLSSGS